MIIVLIKIAVYFVAAVLPWAYASHEAGKDASKITANKAIDHGMNLFIRGLVGFAFTVVMLIAGGYLVAGAYFMYYAGVFAFLFTTQLNISREPARPKWYISLERNAALSDRLLVKIAKELHEPVGILAQTVYTCFLWFGILAFVGAIVYNFYRY